MTWRFVLMGLCALLLVSCTASPPAATPSPLPTPPPLPTATQRPAPLSPLPSPSYSPLPLPPRTPTGPSGSDPVEIARTHLAELLDLAPQEIAVLGVRRMEMPLVGLGCTEEAPPQPAMVLGTEILLSAQGRTFVYHARGPQVLFCGER